MGKTSAVGCIELVLQCSVCLRLVVLIPPKAEASSLYCVVNSDYLLVPISFFFFLPENQIRTLFLRKTFPLFLLIFEL